VQPLGQGCAAGQRDGVDRPRAASHGFGDADRKAGLDQLLRLLGYTKDPITAQGISDAFRSAYAFAGRRTFDDALGDYQRLRDTESLSIYEFTTQMATLEPPPPEMQELLSAVSGNQRAMDAFVSVFAGTLSPREFFDPAIGLLAATPGSEAPADRDRRTSVPVRIRGRPGAS
jgi:hypothetical protein